MAMADEAEAVEELCRRLGRQRRRQALIQAARSMPTRSTNRFTNGPSASNTTTWGSMPNAANAGGHPHASCRCSVTR